MFCHMFRPKRVLRAHGYRSWLSFLKPVTEQGGMIINFVKSFLALKTFLIFSVFLKFCEVFSHP